jgi:hypothetical protein
VRIEFESRTILFCFSFTFVLLENHIWLSRGVQVVGAAWCAVMRIMVGVGDLVQRTGDGCIGRVLGGWVIERSGGTVCSLYLARGD